VREKGKEKRKGAKAFVIRFFFRLFSLFVDWVGKERQKENSNDHRMWRDR